MTDVIGQLRTLVRDLAISEEAGKRLEALFLAQGTATTASLAPAPSAEPSAPTSGLIAPAPAPLWERYEDLGLIGRGGMGEVRRVRDRLLGRELAMKLLRVDLSTDPGLQARFVIEARLTASLQHPGILPVHDFGLTLDGRLWFTMKEVRGRALAEIIAALHAEPAGERFAAALRPVLDAYLRACEAVAHAHGEGVLHRDLKPEHVVVGELGEVLVMDWGLARRHLALEPRAGSSLPLGEPAQTAVGQVIGTLQYMPPEQARGERVGPSSDVYALGAILYEILCGERTYSGRAAAVWAQLLHGPPRPVASRTPNALPEEIVALCDRALARDPGDRFPDARALAIELRGVLEGARRRERASALVKEAHAAGARVAARRDEAEVLRVQARSALAPVRTWDPVALKEPGWALEDEADSIDVAAAVEEAAWQQKLRAALEAAPDLPEAHEAVADAYAADLLAAERERAPASIARAAELLRVHDRGRHAALIQGDGALSLCTDPEGAEAWLFRFVERRRRLVPEPLGLLGRTPILAARVPAGSYLLRLSAPGHLDTFYPVHLGRGERWDGVRPGTAAAIPLPLLPEGLLAPDDVYVPAGWALLGGDPAAAEGLPSYRVWIDSFVVKRSPVTQEEYLAFLNDLVSRGEETAALAACPRIPRSMAGTGDVPLFSRDAAGRFGLGPRSTPEHLRYPVASMRWHGAMAYAAWFAVRTGQPWRLLSELEREKATRGADGRPFPWGHQPEATWACVVGRTPGVASIEAIDGCPTDVSPYGLLGLAGNVRDWCIEAWTPDGPASDGEILRILPAAADDPRVRSIRGGAWSAPPQLCRAAARFAAEPDDYLAGVGLRLARGVPGAGLDPPSAR
jgi:eukaryotic-like serine/threonine-protein kinase